MKRQEDMLNTEINLYLDEFRTIIGFPEQGDDEFEELPSIEDMLVSINALGYDGHLAAMKDFKRQNVASLWHPLYNIISHCLTPAQKGSDTLTKLTLSFYYAITHNVQCDFAKIAWEKLIQVVKGKTLQDRKYIPFIRFFTLLVQDAVESNEAIPELEGAFKCLIPIFSSSLRSTGSEKIKPFPIPSFLLNLVPAENPHLEKYNEWLVAVMGSESQQTPTRTAHRSPSEGPSQSKRKRGNRKEGDSGIKQRKKRLRKAHVIEEQENLEAVHDSTPEIQTDSQQTQTPQTTQSQQTQTPPTTPLPPIRTPTPPILSSPTTSQPIYSPSPLASTISQSAIPIPKPGFRLKSRGKKFKKVSAPKGLLKVRVKKTKETPEPSISQTPLEPDSQEFHAVFGDLPEFSDARVASTIHEVTTEIEREHVSTVEEEVLEEQGRNEGEKVEKQREDERSGLGSGQKENDRPSIDETIESSRDEPIRIEVESSHLSQSQTPPIHSDSSQKELVSETHGDLPRTPPSPHLETEDVELREDQPHPSTSFNAQESSRPRDTVESDTQLRTVVGTTVEGSTSCDLQGSVGSPTLAKTTPAFDVGTSSQVLPETGSTDNLSDPGMVNVTQTYSGCKADESIIPTLVTSKESQLEVLRKIQSRKLKLKEKVGETSTSNVLPPIVYLPMLPWSSDFLIHSSSSSSSSESTYSSPSSSPSHQTPTQRTPTTSRIVQTIQPQSTDDLCQLLLTNLLSLANLNSYDRGVLFALEQRKQAMEKDNKIVELERKLASQKIDSENKLAEFERRLLVLESCRPASVSVRRDDPDSDDHPEGENQGEGLPQNEPSGGDTT